MPVAVSHCAKATVSLSTWNCASLSIITFSPHLRGTVAAIQGLLEFSEGTWLYSPGRTSVDG
eukprot:4992039-Lingulodinium_polyedra.AAC.1